MNLENEIRELKEKVNGIDERISKLEELLKPDKAKNITKSKYLINQNR